MLTPPAHGYLDRGGRPVDNGWPSFNDQHGVTMHAWEGQNFTDVALLPQRRDPRRFQLGCATTNGQHLVLQWFRNMPEITQWLRRMEPQRWGLRGADLIAIKPSLEAVLTEVDVHGLSETSRQAHNAAAEPHYSLVWWGDFTTFAAGGDTWSRQFLEDSGITPVSDADNQAAKELHEALRARAEAENQIWLARQASSS